MSYSEPITADTARLIATRVREIPGVAGLYRGHFGEAALLFPGDRVYGLRLQRRGEDYTLLVSLAVYYDPTLDLHQVGAQVEALAAQLSGLPTTVEIADIVPQPLPVPTTISKELP